MSEQVHPNGPGLASAPVVVVTDFQPRWLWKAKSVVHVIISVLFVTLLVRAGYPGWRTAAIAALLFGNWLRNLVFKHHVIPVRAVQEPPVTCTGPSTTAWLIGLASQFVMVGLSGGLRSPFLVATIGPLSSMLVVYGWSRETKTAMRIVFVGAASLILLPTSWLGPSVPEPYFSQLAGLALFSIAFFQTAYLIAMTRALNESHSRIDRAREQMAQEALARARELEHLSAQLSHELKNPLGAIKALVQLARRDACDDQSRERLEVAENEVERMNSILQEYLSFSRPLDKLRRERCSLGALADEVLGIVGAQAATAGVAIRRAGEALVEVDTRRLREALFNLVTNALDATASGGKVEVRIAQRDGEAQVEVRDSGRGMPPEVLERVGTPFFTTREQGTGLGVAMARAAFTQHGGSLEYRSEEGRGTVVVGVLPLQQKRVTLGAASAG